MADTSPLGVPGLDHSYGVISEEKHPKLQGFKAAAIYEEMAENDATVGAGLYSIEGFLRRLEGHVVPAKRSGKKGQATADFVTSCMNDMSRPWSEFISDVLKMLTFGYSLHEVYYKVRNQGKNDDGLLGWADIATRAQTSIVRWDIEQKTGTIRGAIQQNPVALGNDVYLPMSRCVLFRTTGFKNNPEGRSILRNAYRSWYFKKRLEEIEAIGLSRQLVNTPVYEIPARFMGSDATAAEKAVRAGAERTVSLLSQDRLTGLVIPAELDDTGKPTGYKFRLLNASATQVSTDPVIRRYDARILQSIAAEFLNLGTDKTGSFAMAVEKNSNFVHSIERFADIIQDVINTHLIPRLMTVNNIDAKYWPEFKFNPINKVGVAELGLFLSQAAAYLTPTKDTENALRERAQLPEISDEDWDKNSVNMDPIKEGV